jgi:uncharacterized membrane protein
MYLELFLGLFLIILGILLNLKPDTFAQIITPNGLKPSENKEIIQSVRVSGFLLILVGIIFYLVS